MQNNTLKIKKKIPHCCNIHILPQDCKDLVCRHWAVHAELKMSIYKRVPQTTSSMSTVAWDLNANLLFSGHMLNITTGYKNTNQSLLSKTMPIQGSSPPPSAVPCSKLPASLSYRLLPNILESPSNTKQWSKMWRRGIFYSCTVGTKSTFSKSIFQS